MDPSALIEQLQSNDVSDRRQAAEQAVTVAVQLAGFAVPLVKAVSDPDDQVCESVVATLEEMGAPDAAVVGDLTGLVSHQNESVGYWAATLLGRCGQEAGEGVPALVAALTPPAAPAVQQRCAWALGKIGPAAVSAIPALRDAARCSDARLSRLAATSLEQIGG